MAADQAPILAFDELDSTNAEAVRRGEAGEGGPLWITAARQTAGRGRRGRAWETGEGNLAATLLMTTERPATEAAQISFVAALAVADLVRAYLPSAAITLKWPNDVLVDGRKIAGVLVESGRKTDGRLWLATGIGVNLATSPAAADRPATSVADQTTMTPPSAAEAIKRLAGGFANALSVWDDQGFQAIARAWTAQAHGLGQACIANLGAESIRGVAEGLDPDGALRLRLADGQIRRITVGDVFFEGL